MPQIKLLPIKVANMIAAGEVVERPASIVKELVENALDAGARHIIVEIEKGGKDLVRVTDDGAGMDREDAAMAFVRHATSKISDIFDLNTLKTLGFRGEALASIAAVSYVDLKTRMKNSSEGTQVVVKTGRVEREQPVSFSHGTQIEVKHLFINVPARKKFLKTDATEYNYILKTLTHMALGHFGVGFKLIHNGKEVFDFPVSKTLLERVKLVLGQDMADDLLAVDYSGAMLNIQGFAGIPDVARRNRANQYLLLNGREIHDAALSKAVLEAYHSLLPKEKFPVFVLCVELDAQFVDVNVHPRKLEVKFLNGQQVFQTIKMAVQTALQKHNLAPVLGSFSGGNPLFNVSAIGQRTPGRLGDRSNMSYGMPMAESVNPPAAEVSEGDVSQMNISEKRAYYLARREWRLARRGGNSGGNLPQAMSSPSHDTVQAALQFTQNLSQPTQIFSSPKPASVAPASVEPASIAMPMWRTDNALKLSALGQVKNSYIIAHDNEGVVILDQHAAHERVQYMKLMKGLGEGQIVRQQLLAPFPLELSYREAGVFEEYLSDLRQAGFEIEAFGGRTFAVQAIPACISKDHLGEIMKGVIDDLLEDRPVQEVRRREEKVLTYIACRSAVMFGMPMTHEEQAALLSQLDGLEQKFTCPHGRPTMLKLTYEELLHRFGRK